MNEQLIAELAGLAEMPAWMVAPSGQRVGEELAAHTKLLGGDVQQCRQHQTRMRTGYWEAWYTVTVRAADGGMHSVQFRGELRPPDVPPPSSGDVGIPDLGLTLVVQGRHNQDADGRNDPGLPILADLLDPGRAAGLLEQALHKADARYADARVISCSPVVARHKMASRCTIVNHLEYAASTPAPPMLVTKTYHGVKGDIAWRGMTALWNTPLARGDIVRIAEPISFDPEARLLVQGPVPGDHTLKQALAAAVVGGSSDQLQRFRQHLSATADGLVALHHSRARSDHVAYFDEELAEVRSAWGRLKSLVPQLDGAADGFLGAVAGLATESTPDPFVPSHQSFRLAQVLLDGDRVGFIDFDGFGMGEPAQDVALMRATIRCYGSALPLDAKVPWEQAMESRLDLLDELCESFSARYLRTGSFSADRLAAWELMNVFVHLQNAWTKVRPARPATSLAALGRLLASTTLPSA